MARINVEKALASYAKDLEDEGAIIIDDVLTKDIDITAEWTDERWEDGVPVTKMFGRNEDVTLYLDAGTRIRGVAYRGCATECPVIDFFMNGIWYSVQGYSVEHTLVPALSPRRRWPWSENENDDYDDTYSVEPGDWVAVRDDHDCDDLKLKRGELYQAAEELAPESPGDDYLLRIYRKDGGKHWIFKYRFRPASPEELKRVNKTSTP